MSGRHYETVVGPAAVTVDCGVWERPDGTVVGYHLPASWTNAGERPVTHQLYNADGSEVAWPVVYLDAFRGWVREVGGSAGYYTVPLDLV